MPQTFGDTLAVQQIYAVEDDYEYISFGDYGGGSVWLGDIGNQYNGVSMWLQQDFPDNGVNIYFPDGTGQGYPALFLTGGVFYNHIGFDVTGGTDPWVMGNGSPYGNSGFHFANVNTGAFVMTLLDNGGIITGGGSTLDDGSGNMNVYDSLIVNLNAGSSLASQFSVYDASTNIAFNVSSLDDSVATLNNTLDDGSGNLYAYTLNANNGFNGTVLTNAGTKSVVNGIIIS